MTHHRVSPFLPPPQAEKEALLIDVGALPNNAHFFINLVVDEKTLQFYGTQSTLARKLTAIGYKVRPTELKAGRRLDLRCRVHTLQFGKLTVVQRLLPPKHKQEE